MSKKTLSLISNKGGNYVVKVKGNQHRLFKELKSIVADRKAKQSYTSIEKNRGRMEKRTIKIYRIPAFISNEWTKAKCVVYMERERGNTAMRTESYYLSSLMISARKMAAGIRSHWKIENGLHYVKDVVTNEDKSKIKQTNAAAVFAIFRNIAINAFRINGQRSIKNAIRMNSGNLTQLLKFIE